MSETKANKTAEQGFCVVKLPRRYQALLIKATKLAQSAATNTLQARVTQAEVMRRGIELVILELKAQEGK